MSNSIFLLLGSNEGNAISNLKIAMGHLQKKVGTVVKTSSLYKTAPWGKTDQPDFYNSVAAFSTTLNPQQLLAAILDIEKQMGRIRIKKWGPRVIDIDILFFDQLMLNTPDLQIPHPAIASRRFTLVPLTEVCPDLVHPVYRKTIRELLEECSDMLTVELVKT